MIAPGADLCEAARVLAGNGVGCLAVIDADGALRGTLTRRDLCAVGLLPEASGCLRCGGELPATTCPDKPSVCSKCAARAFTAHAAPLAARAGP